MFIAAGRRDAFSVSVWTCWVTDVVAHARRISRTLQSASNNPYCDRQTTTDSQHKRWLLLSLSMHDRVILMRRLSDGHVIRSVKTYTSHDNSYCRTSAKMLTDIQCAGHVRTKKSSLAYTGCRTGKMKPILCQCDGNLILLYVLPFDSCCNNCLHGRF